MPNKQVSTNVQLFGELITMFLRPDGTGFTIPVSPVGNGGFVYSPPNANSYTNANLGAGASFNGTVEEVIQASGTVITVNAAQSGTLTVNWYQDAAGTIADAPAQVFDVTGGVPFAASLPALGNYMKLSYLQGGVAGAVYIDTYYGWILKDVQGGALANLTATVAVANTAVQLPNRTAIKGVTVKAASTNNAAGLFIGKAGVTTANGFQLAPGATLTLPDGNLNLWWTVSANAGDVLQIIGA